MPPAPKTAHHPAHKAHHPADHHARTPNGHHPAHAKRTPQSKDAGAKATRRNHYVVDTSKCKVQENVWKYDGAGRQILSPYRSIRENGKTVEMKTMEVFELEMPRCDDPGPLPYRDDLKITATFTYETSKEKTEITCYGFWDGPSKGDGKHIWRVRFTPLAEGRWTYKTQSACPCFDQITGALNVSKQSDADKAANPLCRGFLMRATQHNRWKKAYSRERAWALTDSTPFLPVGDTQWSFCDEFSLAEFKQWMTALKRFKLNSFLGCVWLGSVKPGNTHDRQKLKPFSGHPSGHRLNTAYFQDLDQRVHDANSKGVLMGLCIGGFPDNSNWFGRFSSPDDSRWFTYVVHRYAAFNVRWMLYGETDEVKGWQSRVTANSATIRKQDPYDHPIGVHFTTGGTFTHGPEEASAMDYVDAQLDSPAVGAMSGGRTDIQHLVAHYLMNMLDKSLDYPTRVVTKATNAENGIRLATIAAQFGESLAMLVPKAGNRGSVTVRLNGMGGAFTVKAIDVQTGASVSVKSKHITGTTLHASGGGDHTLSFAANKDVAILLKKQKKEQPPEEAGPMLPLPKPGHGSVKPLWFEEYWYEPFNIDGPDNVEQGIRNTYRSFLAGLAYPTFGSLMRAHFDGTSAPDFVPNKGAVGKVLATKDEGMKRMGHFVEFFSQLDAEDLLNFQPAWRPPNGKDAQRYLQPKTSIDGTTKGAAGFIFKPVSEPHSAKKGKLVILTPDDIGQCEVRLVHNGRTIETGVFAGMYHNNLSAVYRFNKYGREYPLDLKVELVQNGAIVRSYDIPNPGLRYD